MSESNTGYQVAGARLLPRKGLNDLIEAMASFGYRVIGPTVRDGAIVLDDVKSDANLPIGWGDEQSGGAYRLRKRDDDRVFGFVVGPHSVKRFLFVPRRQILSAERAQDGELAFQEHLDPPDKLAVLGVRPCDMAAILVQDLTFMWEQYPDGDYVRRRANTFTVVVNCSHPASTCFCSSMGTGPRCDGGFDLSLTELYDEHRHDFLIEIGSEAGAAVVSKLETTPASEGDLAAAVNVTKAAEAAITKILDTDNIHDLLLGNLDHPAWQDVADRCLSCANCTMACPTCFCTGVDEVTHLSGSHAERWQEWDSCFTIDHAYIHGGSIRKSTRSRYRQWMTHKLASWIDQFGTSGCVGCGRCITWCPVGIDITEEVLKIRNSPPATTRKPR
ncbi:MAG TPA: 4Fe-4S dicluster domain-containing protein [Rhodothermales bacterium]|nr:4Fe-4S dicluster domain-containing protein [Rhodothermales bacterium]